MCARMLTSSPSVDKFLSLKRDPLTLTVLHSVYLQKSSGDFNFEQIKRRRNPAAWGSFKRIRNISSTI